MTTSAGVTTPPSRTRARAAFHPLRVAALDRLTDDAVAVTFAVPAGIATEFAYTAGQHLTLRTDVAGHTVRRSYSICSAAPASGAPDTLRVGVKRLDGGVFSGWVHAGLAIGDTLDVMTPQGHFMCVPDAGAARHHVAIAAGSGITPVLSIVATVLAREPASRVTLVYGNRRPSSVMFLEEIEDLKNVHTQRLHVVHVLSREQQDAELLSGRLDPPRVEAILDALVGVDGVDQWYLCGPFGMVTGARDVLARRGVDSGRVHSELFHVEDTPPVRSQEYGALDASEAELVVSLDGRTSTVRMASRGQSILAATLAVRPDAPFSCTGGVCGTCRARVVEGEVRMDRNYALEPDEVARGIILACQAHPVSERVVIDYDA